MSSSARVLALGLAGTMTLAACLQRVADPAPAPEARGAPPATETPATETPATETPAPARSTPAAPTSPSDAPAAPNSDAPTEARSIYPGFDDIPPMSRVPHAVRCGARSCAFPQEVCCEYVQGRRTRSLCKAVSDDMLDTFAPRVVAHCSEDALDGETTFSFACRDSRDCPDGTLCDGSDEFGTATCEPRLPAFPPAWRLVDRERCTSDATCRTGGTRCSGGWCRPVAFPQCGSQHCSARAPTCCLAMDEPHDARCAQTCPHDNVGPARDYQAWACTQRSDCGPDMACCVSSTLHGGACEYYCDGEWQAPACDSDADCIGYSLAKCGEPRPATFGIRVCTAG